MFTGDVFGGREAFGLPLVSTGSNQVFLHYLHFVMGGMGVGGVHVGQTHLTPTTPQISICRFLQYWLWQALQKTRIPTVHTSKIFSSTTLVNNERGLGRFERALQAWRLLYAKQLGQWAIIIPMAYESSQQPRR